MTDDLRDAALVASIADHLPIGVWVARAPDGEFIYANRAFEEIMGMGPVPEVRAGGYAGPYGIFRRDGTRYPEDQLPFARALATGATVVVDDLVIQRRDGGRVNVRAHAKPLFDESGKVARVSIAFIDISREVRAEEQLRNIVRGAPLLLFAMDASGVFHFVEGRALDALGAGGRRILGANAFELCAPFPRVVANLQRALAGEEFADRVQAKGFAYDVLYVPQRAPGGSVVGVFGVATDVTMHQKIQDQLIQSDRLASLGTLAASVAHEINNPLTYMIASLDFLAQDLQGSTRRSALEDAKAERMRALLKSAREGAERVRVIARDLKTFARPEVEEPSPVDVAEAVRSALQICQADIAQRARIQLALSTLPKAEGNESRLSQVFVNLFINAAQAIPEGEPPDAHLIEIRGFTDAQGFAVIEVSDSGQGIPEALLPRIFEPFFTTKQSLGTGLGLSISRNIVTAMGGEISVASSPGQGSTFRVRLPASAPSSR